MNRYFALLAAVVVAACGRPGENERAFEWNNELPPGSVVHIRNGVGDISVRRGDGQGVNLSGGVRWRHSHQSDVRFIVSQAGNQYFVCAMWKSSGKCSANGYHGRRVGGLLTMFSLFHRSNDATAALVATLPANVTVDARTDIGSVTVDGISAGVTAHSSKGTVSASNVSGPLALSTTNGDVSLAADSLSDADSIRLTTTNGTVRAQLPPSLKGAFDLSVVRGTLTTDFALPATNHSRTGQHLQGQIGPSTRVVKVHAVNGDVSVMARTGHEH